MGTRTTLVEDLQGENPSPQRDELIKLARSGHYCDFHSSLAAPKMQLYHDLMAARLPALAEKAKAGLYDDNEDFERQQAARGG